MSGFYEPPPVAWSHFRDRLFHPKWDIIETALGRPVPGVLRDLYAAPEALLRSHFYCTSPDGARRAWVDLFLPLDDEALRPYGRTLPPGRGRLRGRRARRPLLLRSGRLGLRRRAGLRTGPFARSDRRGPGGGLTGGHAALAPGAWSLSAGG